jgi:RNA-binding protein YlmH
LKFYLFLFLLILPSIGRPADYSMQLDSIRVADLARVVYGDLLKRSFVLDDEVLQSLDSVTVNWLELSKNQINVMTGDLLKMHGFELQDLGSVLLVRPACL